MHRAVSEVIAAERREAWVPGSGDAAGGQRERGDRLGSGPRLATALGTPAQPGGQDAVLPAG
jgi:hypothetical protein